MGSHPYRIEHSEFYKGKLVVYSMGDLTFLLQNKPGFNERGLLELFLIESGGLTKFKLFKARIATHPKEFFVGCVHFGLLLNEGNIAI